MSYDRNLWYRVRDNLNFFRERKKILKIKVILNNTLYIYVCTIRKTLREKNTLYRNTVINRDWGVIAAGVTKRHHAQRDVNGIFLVVCKTGHNR